MNRIHLKSLGSWILTIGGMLLFISWWGHSPAPENPQQITFSEKDIRGNRISSESLKGKLVILNVWATWCPPCRLEMPGLARIHDGKKVVVIGISNDDPDDLKTWLESNNPDYPVILPTASLMARLNTIHPIEKLPTSFLINETGQIVKIQEGYYGDWQLWWDYWWYSD